MLALLGEKIKVWGFLSLHSFVMHTIFNKATQTLTKCPEMMHPTTLEHFQNYTERQWPRAFCKKMKM